MNWKALHMTYLTCLTYLGVIFELFFTHDLKNIQIKVSSLITVLLYAGCTLKYQHCFLPISHTTSKSIFYFTAGKIPALKIPLGPHWGLPPWRGGGAYVPTTWRICNLEVRSQLRTDHMVRTTILHVTSAKWLVNFRLQRWLRLHSRLLWPLVTSGLHIGSNWYGLSAGEV